MSLSSESLVLRRAMLRYKHLAAATLILIICSACGAESFEEEPVAMNNGTDPDRALVEEAASRLRSAAEATESYNILLSVGEGSRSEAASESLREALANEPGIAFSEVTKVEGGPVEDIDDPGGHVHAQGFLIKPKPQVVVRISEGGDQLYIAARPAGSDPLASSGDWLWVLPTP